MAGEMVTVVLRGALDGYTGLLPGAPYYARYDGGIGTAPDEVSGVSSAVVGKAVTSDILLSQIGTDGETNAAEIAELRRDLARIDGFGATGASFLIRLEEATRGWHQRNPKLPFFYWGVSPVACASVRFIFFFSSLCVWCFQANSQRTLSATAGTPVTALISYVWGRRPFPLLT